MEHETMTQEERSNLEKMNYSFSVGEKVHIKLKRTNEKGKNIFLNGHFKEKLTTTLFTFQENVLGEIRISLSEIRDNGIFKYEEVGE
jgi:hypothetical protein